MIKKISNLFFYILSLLFNKIFLNTRILNKREVVSGINHFFTYKMRPKQTQNLFIEKKKIDKNESSSISNTAIIIQGPLLLDENFTYNTIDYYCKIINPKNIFLSTWNDENKLYLKKINLLGINILKNKKPKNSGYKNCNLQIISSLNGIKDAKRKGFKFVLKTRTDQRIYNPNFLNFLHIFLKHFKKPKNLKLKNRLVGISFMTFKKRIYGLSDMFLFGNIEDVFLYWNTKLDHRKHEEMSKLLINGKTLREINLVEIYFMTEFLKKIDKNFNKKDNKMEEVFGKYFCLIDKEMIDLYWYKYNNLEEKSDEYSSNLEWKELKFSEWLKYYNHFLN